MAPAAGRAPAVPGLVLVCDHARNSVPPELSLGLPAEEMDRHIAYDVGARGVTLAMAEALGAPAVLSRFSRLVIDPNRGADDPTLVMKIYDGTVIPGNRGADAAEVARRLHAYYWPYHTAVEAAVATVGRAPVLVSIHSFTPQLKARAPRPWHVGVLYNHDRRLVDPLLAALAEARLDEVGAGSGPLVVGDNEPYSGQLDGDCMDRHATRPGHPHALIEVRNDLIADAAGQRAWGGLLARAVARAAAAMAD
ncbi:MAG: N-formylglutamate amidohydrolase [Pseudomonadota bacterium]